MHSAMPGAKQQENLWDQCVLTGFFCAFGIVLRGVDASIMGGTEMNTIMINNKQKSSYAEGLISTLVNIVLFIGKLIAGITTGSIALIADAWHTLSDTFTSLIVIGGAWISSKPKDKGHPFGHGRVELIASIIMGTMLGFVSFNFFKDALTSLKNRISVRYSLFAIIVMCASVVIKELLAQYSFHLGKKHKLATLIADGWHHRSDAIASVIVVIGMGVNKYFWWIDAVLGIAVALLITYAAYTIIKSAADPLMGENADEGLQTQIKTLVREKYPEVSDLHHFHVHKYGDHVELTVHARVDGSMNMEHAHDLISKIENDLRITMSLEPTIHLEPIKVNKEQL